MTDEHDPQADESTGPLEGLRIGPPFAIAFDCGLLTRNDEKKIPGCCACLSCDACGQTFRIDLLSNKGTHACPKCRLEYTSVLIVATADDPAILQAALNTVLESNGIRVPNPEGDDDDDDDEQGGEDLEGDLDQGDDDDDDRDDEQPEGEPVEGDPQR